MDVDEAQEETCEAKEEVSQEEAQKRREEETLAARKKELKATSLEQLKELVASKGLKTGKKEDMVQAVLHQEARARHEVLERQARMRAVVVSKKSELEALPLPELQQLCKASGIMGQPTKQVRIEQLLAQWQADDGVDKALAKLARDAREEQLVSTDKSALRKLCERIGVDPLVKEVMVERIIRKEVNVGLYARPKLEAEEGEAPESGRRADMDMIDIVLANEAARKKEQELKKQQEDALASKRQDLSDMTVVELKKLLERKGLEAVGKKDEMVEALVAVAIKEEAAAARKERLRSMCTDDLKKLVLSKGLEVGKKEAMVEAFLANEAKVREELRAYDARIEGALAKKREELEAETGEKLKELCTSKGVKVGMSKEERVLRLLDKAKNDGEIDQVFAAMVCAERREVLLAIDGPALDRLCEETGADPLVKEVMVERILAHEAEVGPAPEEEDEPPAAKKARVAKK